jgi:hypothetical protein
MCAAAGGGFFNMSAVVPKADWGSLLKLNLPV